MAMHKNTYIERVLIALNPDGSFKGAHQESLQVITDDAGAVLGATQLGAVALTAESLALALPAQGALLAQLAAITAERDALIASAAAPPSDVL